MGLQQSMSLERLMFILRRAVTSIRAYVCVLGFLIGCISALNSQCEIVIPSSNGYQVNLVMDPIEIQAPMACPNGYTFKVRIQHNIDFTGSNPPPSLWTLQGYIHCGSIEDIFFSLPNGGGSGVILTSNAWNPASNCANATPELLDCGAIDLIIQGPGIPYQTLTCNVVLPIQLVHFDAEERNGNVVLNWMTASEKDNNYFTVERSKNGQYWTDIITVKGSGNTTEMMSYSAIDSHPISGKNYYRLRQTDYDGRSTYSRIAVVDLMNLSGAGISLYPNPTSGKITMAGGGRPLGIYDILGRNVVQLVRIYEDSRDQFILDFTALSDGLYYLKTNKTVEKVYKFDLSFPE